MSTSSKFKRSCPKNLYLPKGKVSQKWTAEVKTLGANNCLMDCESILPMTAFGDKIKLFQVIQSSKMNAGRSEKLQKDPNLRSIVEEFFSKIPAFKANSELLWASDMLNTHTCGLLDKFLTYKNEFSQQTKFFKFGSCSKKFGVCNALKTIRKIKEN